MTPQPARLEPRASPGCLMPVTEMPRSASGIATRPCRWPTTGLGPSPASSARKATVGPRTSGATLNAELSWWHWAASAAQRSLLVMGTTLRPRKPSLLWCGRTRDSRFELSPHGDPPVTRGAQRPDGCRSPLLIPTAARAQRAYRRRVFSSTGGLRRCPEPFLWPGRY